MPRYRRNAAILAKIETTYAVDAAPTGAQNALLVSNLEISHNYNNVDRELIRPYFGGSEQLAATRHLEISFEVELAGAGTAGNAPAYGPLLRACALQETVTAGNRVEYMPRTAGQESVTIHYHMDGVRHVALGCRGSVEIKMSLNERPVLAFKMLGLDGGASAQANPSLTLTAWQRPLAITDPNTGDLNLGCTYSAGALSGGTNFPSRGLTINLGNDVKHIQLLGGESVEITGRDTTGACALDLTAAQEVSFRADVNANATTTLGFQHGTAAGGIVVLHAPAVQRINPKYEEQDGIVLAAFDLRLLPSVGSDELRLVLR